MRYISTRGGISPVGFCDAVMMGLARDGGLLLPESIPDVRADLDRWRSLDYSALAQAVLTSCGMLSPLARMLALMASASASSISG